MASDFRNPLTLIGKFVSLYKLCEVLEKEWKNNISPTMVEFANQFLENIGDDMKKNFLLRFNAMMNYRGSPLNTDPDYRKELRPIRLLRESYKIMFTYQTNHFIQYMYKNMRFNGDRALQDRKSVV